MGYGYQKRDYEIIDYELWKTDGIARPFRGPKPQKLVNRFNGKVPHVFKAKNNKPEIKKYNTYYPSPEMHLHAADKLLLACQRLIGKI